MKIILTIHAEDRLSRRKILKKELINTIKYPDKMLKKQGKYYYQKNIGRGKIEVVCEKIENNIKVITLYWL